MSTGIFNIVLGLALFFYGQHRLNVDAPKLFVNFRLLGVILIILGFLLTVLGVLDV